MLLNDAGSLARTKGRSRTVIVGSGAVGLYAARELARLGEDVVVVESGGVGLGGFAPESFASIGWKHDGIRVGRSRSLGGTTNLWGGQLVEFQPVDFMGRNGLPWPVSYDEIAPHYARTYVRLGIPAEAQDDGSVLDHVLGARPRFEQGLELFLTRWLKIPSFAVAFDQELRSSSRLRVVLNHTAVGFHGEGGAVTAIRVAGPNGEVRAIEADRFVLAAGTFEIVRLLLHAAQDWRCPWRDNPNIGAGFTDHLGGPVATVHALNPKRFYDTFSTIVWASHKYQPKVRLTNETLERTRGLSIHGMFSFESSVSENLVYLRQFIKAALYSRRISGVADLLRNVRACGRYLVPLMWKYLVEHRVFIPSTSKISLVVQAEQWRQAASRITIDPSHRDANGVPRVVLDWRLSGEELPAIHDFATRCDRALQAAGLARLDLFEDLVRQEPRFLTTLSDTNHQGGGACMSRSPDHGVVDRDLRVFRTDNLYVLGAATFPTNSGANTTFTALAFADRLVDHLASTHANA